MASEEHEDVKHLEGWEISRFNIKWVILNKMSYNSPYNDIF